MAGEITALRVQKRNRDRVNVYLDGRYALALPAIVAAVLKPGQSVSDGELEELKRKGSVEHAYSRALNFLSYRPRSLSEIDSYLKRQGAAEDQVEAVVRRLEAAGLLDDEAFARFWVENRERHRPRGPRALRHELRIKGVSDKIIEGAIASVDAHESAYRAMDRKVRQWHQLDQQVFSRKSVEYLARRGFDYGVAREVAERHWQELAESD